MSNPIKSPPGAQPPPSLNDEDWKKAKPKVRSDLRFFPQGSRDRSVVVEDPLRSKFFRIGRSVYVFVSFLNGNKTVEEAYLHAKKKADDSGSEFDLEMKDLKRICNFISNAQLIHSADADALAAKAEQREAAKSAARFNPVFQKLPLLHPKQQSPTVKTIGRFLFSKPFFLLWLALLATAGYFLWLNRIEFAEASRGILSGNRWLWMMGIWVGLKIVHEFGHGAACYRFGGHVKESGLAFICLFPVAYVDVSSSWRFNSRWQRACVALAGIYVELVIAAIALITWCHAENPVLRDFLYNLIVVSSFTTIVFNLNPLMKFDGYFALTDALDQPGLYRDGQASIQSFFDRLIFGKVADAQYNNWQRLYGVAVIVWRVVVCVGLFITLSVFAKGLGKIFAVIAVGYWVTPIIKRFFASLGQAAKQNYGLGLIRPVVAILVCGTLLLGASTLLFVPQRIVASGVIQNEDALVVRTRSAGFVKQLQVCDGQQVKKGDLLFVLENDEHGKRLEEINLEIEQAELKIEQFRTFDETANVLAETNLLKKLMAEKERQSQLVAALSVYANESGVVQIQDQELLVGSYVEDGAVVMEICSLQQKEIVAAIPQHQFEELDRQFEVGKLKKVSAYLPETGGIQPSIKKLEPKATVKLASSMLGANTGGWLPVKKSTDKNESAQEYELLEPHVTVWFHLTEDESRKLKTGRRVRVILFGEKQSLGYQVFKSAQRWLTKKIEIVAG